jgi:hypothetical protein
VLDQAREDLRSHAGKRGERHRQQSALRWLNSEEEVYLYSFRAICACLGIDASYLRKGVLRQFQEVSGTDASAPVPIPPRGKASKTAVTRAGLPRHTPSSRPSPPNSQAVQISKPQIISVMNNRRECSFPDTLP